MTYKIAFFDMDGTLYQTENDIIQESTIKALQKLKENGFIVCAATGRPLNQMNLILNRVQFDYMVLINGGYVLNKNQELLFENPLDKHTTEEIVDWCNSNKNGIMLHFGDSTYIYDQFYPFYYFCKGHHVLDCLFYDDQKSYHKRHNAYNAVVMTNDKEELNGFIKAHPLLRCDLINESKDYFCFDVFNADNDKFVGINQVLKHLNLKWDECICFGDSTNDIKMLEMAGAGIAMGNASDYVKSFANFHTTSVYEHGIANALNKLLNFDIELK